MSIPKDVDPNAVRVTSGSNAVTIEARRPSAGTARLGQRTGDPHYDAILEGAERELLTNPVGASAATRALLRTRLGDAEYRRVLMNALQATGQDHIKVRVK